MFRWFALAAGLAAFAMAMAQSPTPKDSKPDQKVTKLGDGFVRVETRSYTIEVPEKWQVGPETSFGQRTINPQEGQGQMTTMTAGPPTRQSWDALYRVSLYFIQRDTPGKATPYKVTKTDQGYEACSFSILDAEGFAKARYVILKSKEGYILALSTKIPGKSKEAELAPIFQRLVKTARVYPPKPTP